MGGTSILRHGLVLALALAGASTDEAVFGQAVPPIEINTHESAIVDSSSQVLREIMSIPGKGIPDSLLADAEGVVIVPGMLKGGFVIGAKHGRGVVLVRDAANNWQLPQFVTITGGSVGWQAGIQATDLVLVFCTPKSVQGLLTGKFTIGADASAAAGPVGRQASAATDAALQAEIYSYSRSRGIFAGLALDGSRLQIDRNAGDAYYRTAAQLAPGQAAPLPASSLRLMQEINKYGKGIVAPPAMGQVVAAAPAGGAAPGDTTALRQRLAASSQRLGGVLDEQWRGFLALPAEVYGGDRPPAPEALNQALERFRGVGANANYAALTSRAEFRETWQLLEQLSQALPRTVIPLPPPPVQ